MNFTPGLFSHHETPYSFVYIYFSFSRPGVLSVRDSAGNRDITGADPAEENSNPNADNQPAPVVLRIYQLSSDEIFQRERFMPLWQQDQALLKEQLLARKVTEPVYPGSRETLLLQLQPGTTHIGVLAGFSAAAQAKNKQVIAVLPLPLMQVSLFLDGQALSLTAGADDES